MAIHIENKKLALFVDILLCLLGTFSLACGLHIFVAPNNVAPGGVSGISIIVNHLTGISVGTISLFINIPLLILATLQLGKIFVLKTAICTVAFTFFYDYVLPYIPAYTADKFMAMIFAGLMSGLGIGLVFARRGSTGGSDIVVLLIQKYNPGIKMGKITLGLDIVVVTVGALVFQNVESVMYALVYMVISSIAMDKVIYGVDEGKLIMVISKEKREEITELFTGKLGRGATILQGAGGYTKEESPVIMCAISKRDFVKIRQNVLEVDPRAFIIVLDTKEVLGEGFKLLEET